MVVPKIVGVRYVRPRFGLDVQTRQFADHIADETILLVHDDEFGRVHHAPGMEKTNMQTLASADVVWTAESFHGVVVPDLGNAKRVLHANPEIHGEEACDLILLPSPWMHAEFAAGQITPVERFDWLAEPPQTETASGPQDVLIHIARPAMLDREGTTLVEQALQYVTTPITMWFVGDKHQRTTTNDLVTIRHAGAWDKFADIASLGGTLVQPRRYGGLSLIQLDALSHGMAFIGADRIPERSLWGREWLAETSEVGPYKMKGGRITLDVATPERLADLITQTATQDRVKFVQRQRDSLLEADERSWLVRRDEFRARLEN